MPSKAKSKAKSKSVGQKGSSSQAKAKKNAATGGGKKQNSQAAEGDNADTGADDSSSTEEFSDPNQLFGGRGVIVHDVDSDAADNSDEQNEGVNTNNTNNIITNKGNTNNIIINNTNNNRQESPMPAIPGAATATETAPAVTKVAIAQSYSKVVNQPGASNIKMCRIDQRTWEMLSGRGVPLQANAQIPYMHKDNTSGAPEAAMMKLGYDTMIDAMTHESGSLRQKIAGCVAYAMVQRNNGLLVVTWGRAQTYNWDAASILSRGIRIDATEPTDEAPRWVSQVTQDYIGRFLVCGETSATGDKAIWRTFCNTVIPCTGTRPPEGFKTYNVTVEGKEQSDAFVARFDGQNSLSVTPTELFEKASNHDGLTFRVHSRGPAFNRWAELNAVLNRNRQIIDHQNLHWYRAHIWLKKGVSTTSPEFQQLKGEIMRVSADGLKVLGLPSINLEGFQEMPAASQSQDEITVQVDNASVVGYAASVMVKAAIGMGIDVSVTKNVRLGTSGFRLTTGNTETALQLLGNIRKTRASFDIPLSNGTKTRITATMHNMPTEPAVAPPLTGPIQKL